MSASAIPHPDRRGAGRSGAVVWVLALGGITVSLMQTLIIPIVPELPKLLNSSPSDATWAITATLLAECRRQPGGRAARGHVRQAADAAVQPRAADGGFGGRRLASATRSRR
ncbi:hypothetical protein ACRAWF_04200 [Streptomyces sp. L7]